MKSKYRSLRYSAISSQGRGGVPWTISCCILLLNCSDASQTRSSIPIEIVQSRDASTIQSLDTTAEVASSEGAYRRIPVEEENIVYRHFESLLIRSSTEREVFLASYERALQPRSGDQKLLRVLQNTTIDFNREARVLLRHTESSVTPSVNVGTPSAHGKSLTIPIEVQPDTIRRPEAPAMAYYCFAFVVDISRIDTVVLRSRRGELSLSIDKRQ